MGSGYEDIDRHAEAAAQATHVLERELPGPAQDFRHDGAGGEDIEQVSLPQSIRLHEMPEHSDAGDGWHWDMLALVGFHERAEGVQVVPLGGAKVPVFQETIYHCDRCIELSVGVNRPRREPSRSYDAEECPRRLSFMFRRHCHH